MNVQYSNSKRPGHPPLSPKHKTGAKTNSQRQTTKLGAPNNILRSNPIHNMTDTPKVIAVPDPEVPVPSVRPAALEHVRVDAVVRDVKVRVLVLSSVDPGHVGAEPSHPGGAGVVVDVDATGAARAVGGVVDVDDEGGALGCEGEEGSRDGGDDGGGELEVHFDFE